mmetsp:Transcript_16435/g.33866  ORF Transcript_16435/g.33866 Transcript_16435/m.33866 type:complete len:351 (+) Transcript_16435:184-1236(+)
MLTFNSLTQHVFILWITLTSFTPPFGIINHVEALSWSNIPTKTTTDRLRALLTDGKCHLMPCCYDGLSSRLISLHPSNFPVTFMTGFGVSSTHGYPDSGILTATDNLNAARVISESLTNAASERGKDVIPCIADGDTGYGGVQSIRRTVINLGAAGMAGVMIEDQVSPKRCGHVSGKSVVSFDDSILRVKVACDARDEFQRMYGIPGPLILARTDAREAVGWGGDGEDGLEEGIRRCKAFRDVGADITFLESPRSKEEMRYYCDNVSGPKLANMLEGGSTPILPLSELEDMGYNLAAYPLTMMSAAIKAMDGVLDKISKGERTEGDILEFERVKEIVGFGEVKRLDDRYK